MIQEIKLPDFNYKTKIENEELYILDQIRKKYILLTPEEWVRQGLINYLIIVHHYPRGMMSVETGLSYDRRQKRSDILVYAQDSTPFLLVECKSMEVPLSKGVLEQVCQYNLTIKAQYILVSNGLHYAVFAFDDKNKKYIKHSAIPDYST